MDNQEIKSRTEAATSMLQVIMQKVTYEIIDSIDKKPEWYDNMSGIAIGLANAINCIENDKESFLQDEEDND